MKVAPLRQLVDRIAAMQQYALVAVDEGDAALAGGGHAVGRVVGEQAELRPGACGCRRRRARSFPSARAGWRCLPLIGDGGSARGSRAHGMSCCKAHDAAGGRVADDACRCVPDWRVKDRSRMKSAAQPHPAGTAFRRRHRQINLSPDVAAGPRSDCGGVDGDAGQGAGRRGWRCSDSGALRAGTVAAPGWCMPGLWPISISVTMLSGGAVRSADSSVVGRRRDRVRRRPFPAPRAARSRTGAEQLDRCVSVRRALLHQHQVCGRQPHLAAGSRGPWRPRHRAGRVRAEVAGMIGLLGGRAEIGGGPPWHGATAAGVAPVRRHVGCRHLRQGISWCRITSRITKAQELLGEIRIQPGVVRPAVAAVPPDCASRAGIGRRHAMDGLQPAHCLGAAEPLGQHVDQGRIDIVDAAPQLPERCRQRSRWPAPSVRQDVPPRLEHDRPIMLRLRFRKSGFIRRVEPQERFHLHGCCSSRDPCKGLDASSPGCAGGSASFIVRGGKVDPGQMPALSGAGVGEDCQAAGSVRACARAGRRCCAGRGRNRR